MTFRTFLLRSRYSSGTTVQSRAFMTPSQLFRHLDDRTSVTVWQTTPDGVVEVSFPRPDGQHWTKEDAVKVFDAATASAPEPWTLKVVHVYTVDGCEDTVWRTPLDSLQANLQDVEVTAVSFRGADGKPFLVHFPPPWGDPYRAGWAAQEIAQRGQDWKATLAEAWSRAV